MAERIEQIRMPNGVRVVLEQMPYVKTAAFGVFVAVGSVDETKENNGISHMIEHMMFKGTETYSAKALADRMAVLGDTVNAYTGKEYTAYYGVTVAEELPSLMELLSDMLFHSVFSKDTLAKEKSVVLEEIDMYNDSPDDLVHELLQKRVFRTHPLGFQISGTKGVVRSFTREQLLNFHRKHYLPERMVLSVAGCFDREAVLWQLSQFFCPEGQGTSARLKQEGFRPDGRYGRYFERDKAMATGLLENRSKALYTRSFSTVKRDTSQIHMNLVFPGISYLDKRRYTAAVFQSILGGSNNSLLFQKIREEEGLAYTVYSYGCPYAREGLVHIDAVSAPGQTGAVFDNVLKVCESLKNTEISEKTLATHKSLIRTETILSGESVQSRMEGNGRSVLLRGRVISQEENQSNIDAVTAEQVKEYAEQILCEEQMSVCLVGEISGAARRIQRRFEKLECRY